MLGVHELSLMENILSRLEQAQQRDGFRLVRRLELEVGVLSGVDPLALEFAFQACRQQPLLVEAELRITLVAATGRCPHCRQISPMTDVLCDCPACHYPGLVIMAGDRLRIAQLEVQD